MKGSRATGLGRGKPIADTAFSRWAQRMGGRDIVAKILDISDSWAEKLAQGKNRPSFPLAAKIEKYSRGQVTMAMMDEDFQRCSGKRTA